MNKTLTAAVLALLVGAASPVPDAPTVAAVTGLPAPAVRAYVNAAARTGAPWQLLGAVGTIETNNGRFGGRTLLEDGYSSSPIYGVDLGGPTWDGSFAWVDDSDGGQLDGRTAWDRAVGPMQFLPSTFWQWQCEGMPDPQDIDDAACAAGRMLASHGDLSNPGVLRAAILSYNPSSAYVSDVLERMNSYTAAWPGTPESGKAGGLWVKLRGPVYSTGWAPLIGGYEKISARLGIVSPAVVPEPSGRIVKVQGIEVDSSMAAGLLELLDAARAAGMPLSGSGYRTAADQRELRERNCPDPVLSDPGDCTPATARVGTSNHEKGMAVDFHMIDGSALTAGAAAWLHENGPRFGYLFGIDTEPWHGSVSGD